MTKSSRKVCIVGISLAKGGAERSMAMLSQMLRDKGHEVHLVILNGEVDYEYSGTLFNLGIFKTETDSLFKRLLRFRKLRRYLKNQQFDFIIDHRPKNEYRREQFYQKYIYKGFRKIYVVHSSKQQEYLTSQPGKFSDIYRMNYATVAVSKHIEQEVLQKNGISNTTTIYNAYDDNWLGLAKEKPKEVLGKTYILSYGRINDEVKDFSFLIQAFTVSKLWEENIFLVIMGDGKDKEKLQASVSHLECADKIIFLPFTKNPFPYISHSKIVSLTSHYEGFPMVLVESLSLGTPVVSLDIKSGPSEIIKDRENGLLIKERNVSLFAEGLKLMFEDEQLYEKCKANTQKSVESFSKEKIANQWHRLINL